MAQLICRKVDGGSLSKGDIVEYRATGTPFGGAEPDAYVCITVSGLVMADVKAYARDWKMALDYEVMDNTPSLDSWTLRVYTTNADSIGSGAITRDAVETFLNQWNASVVGFSSNSVTFDVTVFDAIKSGGPNQQGFWDINITGVIFTEDDYDQGTGVHTITADYSAIGNNPSYVETLVYRQGATVLYHDGVTREIQFSIPRSAVLDKFKADIKRAVEKRIAKRQFKIDPTYIDTVIGNGGTITIDWTTLSTNYLIDKTAL